MLPSTGALSFEAEDAAGNVTRGEIALGQAASPSASIRQGGLTPPGLRQWASLSPHPVVTDLVASSQIAQAAVRRRSREKIPPVIALTSSTLSGGEGHCRTKGRTIVFENSVLLEIKVTDESEVTRVSLDGQPLPHPRGVQLFFTEIVPLQLDTNNGFVLEAVDEWGNSTQCEIFVRHAVQKARQMSYRLKVFQAPFEIKERCESTALVESAEEYLFSALLERTRFNIGKIPKKFDEKQRLEADGILKATACQDKTAEGTPSLLVFADFFDADREGSQTENEPWIREDVYGEGLNHLSVRKLMEGLSVKILQHFPLVEGHVSERKGKKVFTSLSKAQNIRSNMKLIVFREEGSGATVEQKNAQEILCEARITGVYDKFSEAALIKMGASEDVQPKDKVVTK
jgi:hypothetical protein